MIRIFNSDLEDSSYSPITFEVNSKKYYIALDRSLKLLDTQLMPVFNLENDEHVLVQNSQEMIIGLKHLKMFSITTIFFLTFTNDKKCQQFLEDLKIKNEDACNNRIQIDESSTGILKGSNFDIELDREYGLIKSLSY